MNLEIIEDSSYPSSPIIVYKEKKNNVIQHSFYYEIIEEGVYLNASQSAYISISKGRQYKIPDQYAQPVFHISYGENFEYKISSTSSSSAANKWEKIINPNSETMELKSIENCTDSTIFKQAKKFGNNALELLKSALQNCYSNENYITIVQALDKTQVLQEGYRQIAAVNSTILREGTISNECVLLNKQIEANIRITQVNLYHLKVEKDFTDAFEQEIIDKIDKIGAQRSIKDLLNYIIPYLEQSNILKCTDPVVYLRISGDG
ncbi:28991_t:CDS:2 [Gigaspora margarita]|uniref:28991_t:CDS:1 n=1 Tax=Gigaspora margarita TaxID=4874 RepID=A0ABN7V711_GIGMA|nr:28991_t:CDS:2 [Gigaspora margarita]